MLRASICTAALLLAGLLAGCDSADFDSPPALSTPSDGETYVNSLGMTFQRIPADTFSMGSAEGQENERPVRSVVLTEDFYMAEHEVMQRSWNRLMEENPSEFLDPYHPVESVTWPEVQTFIQRLNEREEDNYYRLPTEAEWEYAARAGSATAYHYGDNPDRLGEYAWYALNAEGSTYPVRRKKPNAFGLFDMHGNVWEWVQDYYHPTYYRWGATTDPQGPSEGRGYVIRGGGWRGVPVDLRTANRGWALPDYASPILGFRLVRESAPPADEGQR